MKISHAISRTTGPNIGFFVFILMHFPCWIQIMSRICNISNFSPLFCEKIGHFSFKMKVSSVLATHVEREREREIGADIKADDIPEADDGIPNLSENIETNKITCYLKNHSTKHRFVCNHFDVFSMFNPNMSTIFSIFFCFCETCGHLFIFLQNEGVVCTRQARGKKDWSGSWKQTTFLEQTIFLIFQRMLKQNPLALWNCRGKLIHKRDWNPRIAMFIIIIPLM